MIYANSSTDRDVGSDSEVMENTDATALNTANTQDRSGSFNATSGGSSYMSLEKSTTVIIKPVKEVQDGNK